MSEWMSWPAKFPVREKIVHRSAIASDISRSGMRRVYCVGYAATTAMQIESSADAAEEDDMMSVS